MTNENFSTTAERINESAATATNVTSGNDEQRDAGKNHKTVNDESTAYYKQVALNMRKVRRQLNLTQQQIADAMEIPRSTYKSLESGEVGIYCFHMAKWSVVTGYDIRVITKGTLYDTDNRLPRQNLIELVDDLSQTKYDSIVNLLKVFKD